MGGERETTIPQGKSSAGATAQSTIIQGKQNVRIHENRTTKEVHFHVDQEKLKAAVPTAVWYKTWERISRELPSSWTYMDRKNNTSLTVAVSLVYNDQILEKKEIHAVIHVDRVAAVNPVYSELEKFTEGKR